MPDEWKEKDGLLYYKNRLYIPEDEALQMEIAQGCHDSLVAGQFGQKTIEIVMRDLYGRGLAECICDYVRSCAECQHSKSTWHAKYGLLQPFGSTLCPLDPHIASLHYLVTRIPG